MAQPALKPGQSLILHPRLLCSEPQGVAINLAWQVARLFFCFLFVRQWQENYYFCNMITRNGMNNENGEAVVTLNNVTIGYDKHHVREHLSQE